MFDGNRGEKVRQACNLNCKFKCKVTRTLINELTNNTLAFNNICPDALGKFPPPLVELLSGQ